MAARRSSHRQPHITVPIPCRLPWAPVRARIDGGRVVNLFQLHVPSVLADAQVRRRFYLDATLRQLVDTFGDLATMAAARVAWFERQRA